jgi:hypothetical protein
MSLERAYSLILGLLIVAVAIFVLFRMYLTSEKLNAWKTRFNTNTLLLDITLGMIIIFNSIEKMNLIGIAVIILLITHLYRVIEYFNTNKKSKLLLNYPYFIIHTIKLLGLFGIVFIIF